MMTRRKLVRLVVVLIGVPLLLLTIALLYLNFANLGGWRDTVGRLATRLMGRELLINGDFELDIGFTTRLVASDITLANPPWSDDPEMASVDHLAGEIDLLSFLFGPMTIHNVEITGARALFELGSEGRFNWSFSEGEPGKGGGGDVELVISHALVRDLRVVYTSPQGQALEAELSKLEFTDEGGGMLDLDLVGSIGGTPLEVSGRLGTFVGLINAAAVEHDLTGRFADAEFTFRGTIDDLSSLTGVDEEASASGSDLEKISASLGLDLAVGGPFSVNASLKRSASGTDLKLDAAAGGINARITGVVDSLTKPSKLDAVVAASGPSIRTVGTLTGITDLPEEEFSVSGGIRWNGFPIQVKQLEISVGDNSLSADGVLGTPPRMLGTDFTLQGDGPNASLLGALVGVDLPRESFSVSGRVVRVDGGIDVEDLEARIGRNEATANGTVGDPPDYSGTTLSIHAAGPNVAVFSRLVGIDLPAEPFAIDGRLTQGEQAIALEGVSAQVGRVTVRADGELKTGVGLSGSILKIDANGPDATQIALLAGFTDLPAEPWAAAGRLTILERGYQLDGVSADVGSLRVKGDGLIAAGDRSVGTHLRIHIEDPDLSHAMSIFGIEGFPQQPVRAVGGLKIEDSGYRLDGVTATAGDIDIAVDGLVGGHSNLEGTSAALEVHGPRLSSVGPYFNSLGLPQTPFSVSGTVQVTGGRIDLGDVVADVDSNRVTVNGAVGAAKGLVGTDVQVEVSAPDLGRVGRLVAGLMTLPDLPAAPLTLTTRLRIDDAGYEIDGLHLGLDRAVAEVDGRVGRAAKGVGTDLRVTANAPDASLFSAFTGATVASAPFKVRGRIQRTDAAVLFDQVSVELGGHSIALHGSLGGRPRLVGTELDLSASGPGTALIAELTGFNKLPDKPFSVAGHFEGTPEKFSGQRLDVVLGESDLKGSLEIDIRDKPTVTATVTSDHLDLSHYLKPLGIGADEGSESASVRPSKSVEPAISNQPIDFSPLQRADANVDITVGTIQFPLKVLHDVTLGATLADGRLEIEHLAASGQDQGHIDGNLLLEPTGDQYLFRTILEARQILLDIPGSPVERSDRPPIDIDIDLAATGATPHEFASSADGVIKLVIGKGVMDSRALDLVTADFLLTLLKAFNPFAKEDAATELQCGVALMSFEDGLAKLEPMAFQSDKMTLLGDGKIDFRTEEINLEWVTKPRKGIGISASMITNPYIKLGGTLGKPAIELKGAQAVASTGVAVATLGISMVAKGMLDRVTAEKKVCQQALEEIGSRTGGSAKKPKKKK